MTPLKEIKEPRKPTSESTSKEKPDKPSTSTDDPWKVNDDGTRVRQGRKLPYEKQLHQLFREIGGAIALVDSFSAEAFKLRSEELAYGYAKLAQEDDRVKAFFARVVAGSAYSSVVVPTACVLIPILWHFGLVPARVGVPVTFMSGLPLVTREQEQQYKTDQAKEQQRAAEAAAARATHPNGEAPGDSSSTPE